MSKSYESPTYGKLSNGSTYRLTHSETDFIGAIKQVWVNVDDDDDDTECLWEGGDNSNGIKWLQPKTNEETTWRKAESSKHIECRIQQPTENYKRWQLIQQWHGMAWSTFEYIVGSGLNFHFYDSLGWKTIKKSFITIFSPPPAFRHVSVLVGHPQPSPQPSSLRFTPEDSAKSQTHISLYAVCSLLKYVWNSIKHNFYVFLWYTRILAHCLTHNSNFINVHEYFICHVLFMYQSSAPASRI